MSRLKLVDKLAFPHINEAIIVFQVTTNPNPVSDLHQKLTMKIKEENRRQLNIMATQKGNCT